MEYVGIAIGIMIGAIMTLCVWAISDCMINRKKIVMTQEEKARAYDEALERARKLYNDAKANEYKSDMEDYESIFPELAESEDERIRKTLVEYISDTMCDEDHELYHISKGEALAYLEKQGEQKVSVDDFKAKDWYVSKVDGKIHNIYYSVDKVKPKFKVGDKIIEKNFDECGRGTIIDIKDGKYIFDDGGFICIEEQGLWKLVEQKPAEWSPTKEQMVALSWAANGMLDNDSPSAGDIKASLRTLYNDLQSKSIRPAEWSEEDEKDMAHIIRILDDCYVYGTHDLSKTDRENLVNKLKSLRLQYHGDVTMTEAYKMGKEAGEASRWKPSEEQMDALHRCVDYLHGEGSGYFDPINSLYEQLKKL